MARAAVTVTVLTPNTVVADLAGNALDATNHHVVTVEHPLDSYIIRITNTTASTKAVTIKAGDSPPATSAGQGDLSVSCAAGNVTPVVKYIGALESARFIQNDGTLNLDVDAAMTGYVACFRIPRA